ncbi:hypothetical protein OQA88_379 [Cercophora sp. LCS_1]
MDMPPVLVPPGAGKLYYIPLGGLHPDTTWRELKAHVQRVCPVHYCVIYPVTPTAGERVNGWVRVSGKKNFNLALGKETPIRFDYSLILTSSHVLLDHLQSERLRGLKLSVSVDNLYKEITVRMPEEAFVPTPENIVWPGTRSGSSQYATTLVTQEYYDVGGFEYYTNQQYWYTSATTQPPFTSSSSITAPSPRILCIRHLPGRSWSKSQNRVMIEHNLPPDLKHLAINYETLFLPIRNDKPEPTDTIFVEFADHESAVKARDHLHGKKIRQNEANSNSKRRRLVATLVERYPWCKVFGAHNKDKRTTTGGGSEKGESDSGSTKGKEREREPAIARGSFAKEKEMAPVVAYGSSYVPAGRETTYQPVGWEDASGQVATYGSGW